MEFKVGDIVVSKITGQYFNVIEVIADDVRVRLARETKENGTYYETALFFPEELESVEQHLRRELSEMELRQTLLDDAKKRLKQREIEEASALPAPKTSSSIVN